MSSRNTSIRLLAAVLASGAFEEDPMMSRAAGLLGSRPRWLRPLVRDLLAEFGSPNRPPEREIRNAIRSSARFSRARSKGKVALAGSWLWESSMVPALGAPQSWQLPSLTRLADTAEWLGLETSQLLWLTRHGGKDHYHHRWIPKRRGGWRLLESPKPLLKRTQRRILDALLHHIPVHEACHGFRPGGSIRQFIAPHTGQNVVLKIDLADFFPSVTAARIFRIFLNAGYPEHVAQVLTRLTTHPTPSSSLPAHLTMLERQRLRTPHLPQGAPSSPTLANLAAFRLDCRLSGLAQATEASYTRYADDLLFSGGEQFARAANRFQIAVIRVISQEGFRPNPRKTRVMHTSQRQKAAGVILNESPNIDRREWDRLKATLTNCLRHGLESQNREAHPNFRDHLAGKISWVESIAPARGETLRAIFRQIPD